jgi:hypothetical protein
MVHEGGKTPKRSRKYHVTNYSARAVLSSCEYAAADDAQKATETLNVKHLKAH